VNGTAAIVEFPGVMYRSGAEQKIRKYLVDNNYVDAVIQLPADLFFGTGIQTCILVLKKSKSDNKVLFINAEKNFVREGNKNKFTQPNRNLVYDAYVARQDVEYFARLADHSEIQANDYGLAVTSYVTSQDTREVIDIQDLNKQIAAIVSRQDELRTAIDAIVADLESTN
jgi:type I restriction enzyme M protein